MVRDADWRPASKWSVTECTDRATVGGACAGGAFLACVWVSTALVEVAEPQALATARTAPSDATARRAPIRRITPSTLRCAICVPVAYDVRVSVGVGYDDPKARVKVRQPAQVAVTGVPDT
jgi:hypothetical protein